MTALTEQLALRYDQPPRCRRVAGRRGSKTAGAERGQRDSALFGTFTASPGAVRTVRTDQVGTGSVLVGDTDTVAMIDQVGSVHLVDLATGERRRLAALADEDEVTDHFGTLVANKDGRYLAAMWRPGRPVAGSMFTRLTVWDVDTGERRFDPVPVLYLVGSMAISDDGGLVAVSGGRTGMSRFATARREVAP